MAKKTRKSGLISKLGPSGAQAIVEHGGDDTKYDSGGSLPAGIENGIAQLCDCRFSQYKTGDNKGEYFFLAAGIVKVPTDHEKIPIEGLRTQIMEPLHDTPTRSRKKTKDHLAWVLNELRKFGVDTSDISVDSLEEIVAALKEEKPHFRFRTWKGDPTKQYPNPRTNEVWGGVVDYDPDEEEVEVEDNAEEEEEPKETKEEEDLSALGKAADGDDEEAQATLTAKAEEAGLDPDDYAYWINLADALTGPPEDEEGDFVPKKGQVFLFKPPRAKKATEFEVTAVFAGNKTCNGKTLEDDKAFKGIPWSKLEGE